MPEKNILWQHITTLTKQHNNIYIFPYTTKSTYANFFIIAKLAVKKIRYRGWIYKKKEKKNIYIAPTKFQLSEVHINLIDNIQLFKECEINWDGELNRFQPMKNLLIYRSLIKKTSGPQNNI